MDHKVSKDMISSGMIPSGEKTQADLGRTQYGSAPSPSSLMDAYRSIYEHHQKDKDGNTIPHENEINEMAGGLAKKAAQRGMAAKAAKNRQLSLPIGKTPATKADASKMGAQKRSGPQKARTSIPQGNPSSIMGRVSQGLSSASQAAGRADKAIAARGGLKKMGTDYLKKNKGNIKGALLGKTAAGTATRIAGAAVVGRMTGGDNNSGGYDGYRNMQKFDYVPDGDTLSEDLFDLVKSALIEEGYDEKSALKLMSSFTPELLEEVIEQAQEEAQKKNLNEIIVSGTLLATALAKGALAAKTGLAAAKATKLGLAAVKGAKAIGGAVKGAKAATTAAKVTSSGTKAATAGTKAATAGTKAATTGAKVTQSGGQVVQGGGPMSKVGKAFTAMKKKPLETAMVGSMVMPQGGGNPNAPAAQRTVGTGKRTAGVQTMDLDLFDIVKGHLLDEGLTEEECGDVMTTLTLEEINETLQLNEVSAALAKRATLKAGAQRGIAASQGKKDLAMKRLGQEKKFSGYMKKKNLATSRAENMRKPTGPMVSRPQPDPTKPYPGTPR